ncbi:hypothetical protein [Haladaptatus pallidirubidus]|uniref:hypothetical protein n=1 Tax=Haladaptatus pallidirubidus TaxID=1008152 RepID=UPI001D10C103|nr:hypothetical protein [Haladaptatus pallidirubidus]
MPTATKGARDAESDARDASISRNPKARLSGPVGGGPYPARPERDSDSPGGSLEPLKPAGHVRTLVLPPFNTSCFYEIV